MARSLSSCLNIADLRARAGKSLPGPIFDFLDGGAEDERTLARNRAAFDRWALLPYALNDVSKVDASCTVLGQALAWPFLVGPTGMPGLFHPDGEIAVAGAAATTCALYTLSTMASRSIEEVAAATDAPKAFQLYVFRDRGITRELLERAKAAGYAALVLTVDIQVPANRERDRRSGMTIPPRFGARSLLDFARHPRWCWDQLVRSPVRLANFEGRRADPGTTLLSFINDQFDPSTTWADLEWVAQLWGGPLAIKGILRPDDAARAAALGASAVILSNHGGRQMDAAPGALDMIEQVAESVDGRAEIILDGGVRRGTDMLKALALGAKACMAGRVGLYGLAAGGEPGAEQAFRILRTEFERGLGLLGTPRADLVDRSAVIRI